MKSIKNHLSLVLAIVSILFSLQIFVITDRAIDAYKEDLAKNYSVIVVSQKTMDEKSLFSINGLIKESRELEPDNVIKRFSTSMERKNVELLKISLPKFYKLSLRYYPSPSEIKKLREDLLRNSSITKVEDFSSNHDVTYKLLLLFKGVITVFSFSVFLVTTLLIFKELRIWQFKHSERMSIMSIFGAPVWLRSAVLFRLAIVDAVIASVVTFGIFVYISSNQYVLDQIANIGINIILFNIVDDFVVLFCVAMSLSILLASLIVIGHKEEA